MQQCKHLSNLKTKRKRERSLKNYQKQMIHKSKIKPQRMKQKTFKKKRMMNSLMLFVQFLRKDKNWLKIRKICMINKVIQKKILQRKKKNLSRKK